MSCCVRMQGLSEGGGRRGFTIYRRAADDDGVYLQHRSRDIGENGAVDSDAPLVLIGDVGIFFCPWCGRRIRPKDIDVRGELSPHAVSA